MTNKADFILHMIEDGIYLERKIDNDSLILHVRNETKSKSGKWDYKSFEIDIDMLIEKFNLLEHIEKKYMKKEEMPVIEDSESGLQVRHHKKGE